MNERSGAPTDTATDAASADRWAAWRAAAGIMLGSRLVFIAVAYAASWYLADGTGHSQEGLFDIWSRWDARHLQQAAEFGYTDPRTDPHITAFFPLFPLLLRAVAWSGLSYVVSGMLISAVASVVAGAFLYRLAEEEIGEGSGRRALLYLALFPTGVFLIAPYSEAVFLAGAIPAFYFARRGRWHLVGLPAAVAVGARFAGVFLLFGLVCEFLRQRNFTPERLMAAAASLAVGTLPLLMYGAYLARIKGSAFYFFTDQREGWQRDFTNPIDALRTTWDTWNGDYPTGFVFAWRIEVLAAAVGLGFVVWALTRKEWGYAGFMGALLGAMLTSFVYQSIPRMLLTMFPIALLLAGVSKARSYAHEYLLLTLAPLATLGVIVYTRGAWFY